MLTKTSEKPQNHFFSVVIKKSLFLDESTWFHSM